MMTYIIWDVSPEIIEGFTFLRWYGVSWVIGIFLGQSILQNIYKKEGIPTNETDRVTVYVMLGAVVGARFGHILFYDPIHYFHNPIEILPIKINPEFEFTGLAGLASHGGTGGALLALYLYNRKLNRGYFWLLDRLVISAAALGSCIRLGNLMNSEIIGTPTDLPWAFVFMRVDLIPRHPSQLYEALFYFALSVTLYYVWKSKRFISRTGFIFGLGITLLFIQRFFIEFIKEHQVSFEEELSLNMGQILSIPLIAAGVIVMVWSSRDRSTSNQAFNDRT